jgi:hypothetical protein
MAMTRKLIIMALLSTESKDVVKLSKSVLVSTRTIERGYIILLLLADLHPHRNLLHYHSSI